MKFLVFLLMPFSQISLLFKVRSVFTKFIDGRNRNPAFPEQGRFTKKEAQAICKAVLKESRQLRRTMPKKETFGGKFMVRGAVGLMAIYRGLRNCGIEHAYAIELGGDIGYELYKYSFDPIKRVARLFARNPSQQMDLIQRLVIKIALQSPDYAINVCNTPNGSAYDIHLCPMADYVKTFGPEEMEFFQKTGCTFDWPIAEYCVKGGWYNRTTTISHGDEFCDQRWGAST